MSRLLPGLDLASLPEREERESELVTATGTTVPVRVLRQEVALGHRLQTVIAVRDQRERVNRRPKRTPYRRAKGTPFVKQRDGYGGRTVRAGCGVGRA